MKRITVAGAGYVGLSNAVMLARQQAVTILDIDAARIEAIRQRASPISDPDIERQLRDESLHLATSTDPGQALAGADYVFIATPTNYDPHSNQFDTESVQSVVRAAMTLCPEALIVIKSTVPVGFTEALKAELKFANLVFSPEFLREGSAAQSPEGRPVSTRTPLAAFAIGAAASLLNPVAGVVTYLAQKMLSDPIEKLFAFEYAVTGAWSDPQVAKRGAAAAPDSR